MKRYVVPGKNGRYRIRRKCDYIMGTVPVEGMHPQAVLCSDCPEGLPEGMTPA